MARQKRTTPYERLNLEFHPEVRLNLERLREQTRADSISQVIRRALSVYDLLMLQHNEGGKIIVRSKDGAEKELLLAE